MDIEAALTAKGLKAVCLARFAVGVKDLREDLKAEHDADVDAVFSYTVGVENAVIANGRKERSRASDDGAELYCRTQQRAPRRHPKRLQAQVQASHGAVPTGAGAYFVPMCANPLNGGYESATLQFCS